MCQKLPLRMSTGGGSSGINLSVSDASRGGGGLITGVILDLLSLRPRQVHLAFSPKNIAVEVGDPLPAAGGHIEIADRKLDLRRDIGPVELREFINDVGGRRVAQRLVQPDFLELVKKRIRLPHVIGVAELADQIGGAQQQPFLLVEIVSVGLWCRCIGEAGVLDRPGNPSRVDFLHVIEPLNDEQL